MDSISSNHFSVDQQASDALDWLRGNETAAYCEVRRTFSEAITFTLPPFHHGDPAMSYSHDHPGANPADHEATTTDDYGRTLAVSKVGGGVIGHAYYHESWHYLVVDSSGAIVVGSPPDPMPGDPDEIELVGSDLVVGGEATHAHALAELAGWVGTYTGTDCDVPESELVDR